MLLGTTGYKRQSGGEREGAIDLAGAATPLMALSHPFSGISSRSYDDLQIKNYSETLRAKNPTTFTKRLLCQALHFTSLILRQPLRQLSPFIEQDRGSEIL